MSIEEEMLSVDTDTRPLARPILVQLPYHTTARDIVTIADAAALLTIELANAPHELGWQVSVKAIHEASKNYCPANVATATRFVENLCASERILLLRYAGRTPRWDGRFVHFDIPGTKTKGNIWLVAPTETEALALFHSKWPAIAPVAVDRAERDHLENGEVALNIAMF